ncbi:MAG TPA: hypothetical protein VK817_13945 [Trebonia sp.]|nr:hypothetical protein [Trebonia sp.]
MSNPEFRNEASRGQRANPDATYAMARAVAERERGRHRLNVTTAILGISSAGVAGVIALLLPGATHAAAAKTVTPAKSSSSTSGSSTSGSSSQSDKSSSSSSSSSVQTPSSAPQQSSGNPVSTSGGTS